MQGPKRGARLFGSLFLLGTLLLFSLAACGTGNGGGNGGTGNGSSASSGSGNIETPTAAATADASPTGTALTVLGVDMAVNPQTLGGYTCGSHLTVTYTATFHFPDNNAGGPVAFEYTTDNGRGSTQANLTVQPGQTTVTYQFTWSGALPADHTMPEPGGVMVTSPNSLTSALVGPTGSCSSANSQFIVQSVTVTASPSLNGHKCGTLFVETYTATFTFPAGNPGGTIVFTYTTDNGRGNSQNINLYIAPGQTTKTYKFTWQGLLPADNTAPGHGIVLVSAPNSVTSTGGEPSGQCTP